MLKEHLEDLTQRHGEHESAMNEAITTFVHFLRAIHTIVAISNLRGVVSNGCVTFNVANNGRYSPTMHNRRKAVQDTYSFVFSPTWYSRRQAIPEELEWLGAV